MCAPTAACWLVPLTCAILSPCVVAAADDRITPDRDVQALIDRVARARQHDADYFANVMKLRDLAGRTPRDANQRRIILQAVYYSAYGKRPAEEARRADDVPGPSNALFLIVGELGLTMTHVLHAVLPYLDTPEMRLREFIRNDLLQADAHVPEEPQPDEVVRNLVDYVRPQLEVPQFSAVEILYNLAPTTALLSFSTTSFHAEENRQKRRAVLWAQHVVRDAAWKKAHDFLKPEDVEAAVAELDKLSRFDEWWVRLYVAEMLRRHEFLRRPHLIERLRRDPIALVRTTLDKPLQTDEPEDEEDDPAAHVPAENPTRRGRGPEASAQVLARAVSATST